MFDKKINMERLRAHKFERLSSGSALNVEELFEKVIKPQFAHKEAIKELHNSLMKYVKLEGATFFLRLYGSFPKDSYGLLRRGFLTEYQDKTRMVFCDNTFSMIFAGLKISGISLSENQISEYLSQKQLICSFGLTTKEKELSYYTPQKAIRLPFNAKGWYQAHIKSTGHSFDGMSEKKLSDLFPNPNRAEWNEDKIRKTSENLSDEQKKLLIAHFIRLVHPLNSFLVPKRNHIKYDGKRIGEELEVILHVRDYLKKEFPSEYKEFEEISMGHPFPETSTKITNITWFEDPVTEVTRKGVTKKKEKSTKEKTEKDVAAADIEEETIIHLEKQLKSIGKDVFVMILYPALYENLDVTTEEIASKHPKFAAFKSQKNRLSTAKSIFKKGLQIEALNSIVNSSRLDSEVRDIAENYLKHN